LESKAQVDTKNKFQKNAISGLKTLLILVEKNSNKILVKNTTFLSGFLIAV